MLREEVGLLEGAPEPPPSVAFLPPFDPLVWDRGLLGSLFDFDYVWELFLPPAKRRWGWYVLPLLFRDRLVGRIEPRIEHAGRQVQVTGLWWEEGFVPRRTEGFVEAIGDALGPTSTSLARLASSGDRTSRRSGDCFSRAPRRANGRLVHRVVEQMSRCEHVVFSAHREARTLQAVASPANVAYLAELLERNRAWGCSVLSSAIPASSPGSRRAIRRNTSGSAARTAVFRRTRSSGSRRARCSSTATSPMSLSTPTSTASRCCSTPSTSLA